MSADFAPSKLVKRAVELWFDPLREEDVEPEFGGFFIYPGRVRFAGMSA
jgi:hypothetical protein